MPEKRRYYEPVLSLKHVWEKKEQNRIKGLFSLDAGWMVTFHSSGPDAGSLTIERQSKYHPDDEDFPAWRDQTIDNVCALLFVEKSAMMDSYTYYGKFRGGYKTTRLFAVRVRMARKPRVLISDDDPQWALLRPRIVESAAQSYWAKHKDESIKFVSLATERDQTIDECERREEIEIIGNRASVDQVIVDLVDQKEEKAAFLNNQGRIGIKVGKDQGQTYWEIEVEYMRMREDRQKGYLKTFDPVNAASFIKPYRVAGDEIANWSYQNYTDLLERAVSNLQADLRSETDQLAESALNHSMKDQ